MNAYVTQWFTSWLKYTHMTLGIIICTIISFPLCIITLNYELECPNWTTLNVIMYILFRFKNLLILMNSIILIIRKRDTLRPIHLSFFGSNTLEEAITILNHEVKSTINNPIGIGGNLAWKQSTWATLICLANVEIMWVSYIYMYVYIFICIKRP